MNSPSHPTSNGSTISTPSSPGGADINSLRQQLREAKATIQSLSLQAKLSSKQVAFGSSVPTGRLVPASPQTQPSSTPAIDPPSPSRLNASTSGSIFETTVSLSLRSARRSISPAGNQSSGDNPFFGGNGTSRERLKNSESSKNSGSGKVISGLQSDLSQARSIMDSTRSQLKLSQRAVEFLTKANDEWKETKEQLTNGNEALSKMLLRKERSLEEALSRLKLSEATLTSIAASHRTTIQGHKSRLKEMEDALRRSEEKSCKSESECKAAVEGIARMKVGWTREVESLRKEMKEMEEKRRKEQAEDSIRFKRLKELHESRDSNQSLLVDSLARIESARVEFSATFKDSLKNVTEEIANDAGQTEENLQRTIAMEDELKRILRMIRLGGQNDTSVSL